VIVKTRKIDQGVWDRERRISGGDRALGKKELTRKGKRVHNFNRNKEGACFTQNFYLIIPLILTRGKTWKGELKRPVAKKGLGKRKAKSEKKKRRPRRGRKNCCSNVRAVWRATKKWQWI